MKKKKKRKAKPTIKAVSRQPKKDDLRELVRLTHECERMDLHIKVRARELQDEIDRLEREFKQTIARWAALASKLTGKAPSENLRDEVAKLVEEFWHGTAEPQLEVGESSPASAANG